MWWGAADHSAARTALCGGLHNLRHHALRRFGINATFAALGHLDDWGAAVRPSKRLFFSETAGNPSTDAQAMAMAMARVAAMA